VSTASVAARVIEKIIAKLKTVSDITSRVGSGANARIYGAHISTVVDAAFPAISIMVSSGARAVTEGGMTTLSLQIDIWMKGAGQGGKDGATWDDVMEVQQAISNELHRNGGWDNTIGIKIFEITNTLEGPQMYETADGVLHYPSRWRVRAAI
jgi:hypothetical protein